MFVCSVQSEDCKEPKQVCKSVPKELCYNTVANLCPCTCKTVVLSNENLLKSDIDMKESEKHADHDHNPVSETSKFLIVSWY